MGLIKLAKTAQPQKMVQRAATTSKTSTKDNQQDSIVDKSKEETVNQSTYFTILYDNETRQ